MILMDYVIQEQTEHKIDLVVVGEMRNRENRNPCLILERELSWRIFWIQLQGADLQGRGLKGALIPDTDPILIQDRDLILIIGTEFILNPDRNPVWIQDEILEVQIKGELKTFIKKIHYFMKFLIKKKKFRLNLTENYLK